MRCDAKRVPQGRTDEREPKQLYAIYAVVTATPPLETTTVQPPKPPTQKQIQSPLASPLFQATCENYSN